MKLLLGQNISHRLIASLIETYPGSTHVAYLDMGEAPDNSIWHYAKENGFSIVTQDADFHEYCLLYGGPPLVIWLKSGNQRKQVTLEKLLNARNEIEKAALNPEIWCIEVY
jgi:predicted nuclease of predicted toxin-antitoxin system